MVYYYTIFALFAILCYAIVVDENVATFIDLSIKYLRIQLERLWWMARFHPNNPITNFIMDRKMSKLAKELEKELISKNGDQNHD